MNNDSGRAGTRRFTLLFPWLLAFVLSACAPASDWRELKLDDAGFSVLMRPEPYYTKQQLDTPAGKMFAHLYSQQRRDAFFAVGYADYPLALVVGAPPDQMFAGVRDTWTRRIAGKVVAQDNHIKLPPRHRGIEFLAEGKIDGKDAFVQGRLYLVDQRLYQVIAMGPKHEVPQGVVNRFFNSFRLIEQREVGTLRVEPGK